MKIKEQLLITNFIDPYKKFYSEYGNINGLRWLKKEKVRIGDGNIVRDKKGLMALIRTKEIL